MHDRIGAAPPFVSVLPAPAEQEAAGGPAGWAAPIQEDPHRAFFSIGLRQTADPLQQGGVGYILRKVPAREPSAAAGQLLQQPGAVPDAAAA